MVVFSVFIGRYHRIFINQSDGNIMSAQPAKGDNYKIIEKQLIAMIKNIKTRGNGNARTKR